MLDDSGFEGNAMLGCIQSTQEVNIEGYGHDAMASNSGKRLLAGPLSCMLSLVDTTSANSHELN